MKGGFMKRAGFLKASACASVLALVLAAGTVPETAGAATVHAARVQPWAAEFKTGTVALTGQVPLAVAQGNLHLARGVRFIGAAKRSDSLELNFGLALRNMTGLNALIVKESKTHHEDSRAQIYSMFSPPTSQYTALRRWLVSAGYTITHVGADRLEMTARAPVATVERTLDVHVGVYHQASYTDMGVKVAAQDFYANTTAPIVPARLGVQTISGLSNIDQFFTDEQLAKANGGAVSTYAVGASPRAAHPQTRSGGYYPRDVRSMYDVTGVDGYGAGQTIGFTLWGAGENQTAATGFATTTGETALTVSTCTATGNSPTMPSTCYQQQDGANTLLNILENGNLNNNYAGNGETGLDVEEAHGMAPGVAEHYYLGDCSTTVSPGLTNASCNGSDVGLEDAVEDAANDPTLHSVSNSFGYGGDAEWGAADPWNIATNNSFAIAAAAGTTFWFSTGDDGSYESGNPADSPYVVSVGGTSQFSTAAVSGSATAALSSEDLWSAGGTWCTNLVARPSWQVGAGVTANASCPGRAIPDISAIADTNTSVYIRYSTSATGTATESVGGTSVAGPVMNGMEADTENYLAAQTYPGATPSIGFEGPIMYMEGNSGTANSTTPGTYADYFRQVACGNDAYPSGSPDGASAQANGWNQAAGWGAIDWQHYSAGYAITLGATNVSVPSTLSQNYAWSCAKTPGNETVHGVSLPSSTVGYAVGTAASSPWFSTYLPSASWGASNTIYKTTNGGTQWVPSNADMLSIACTSSTNCVEVGDGGVIQYTTNSGSTWTTASTNFTQALTQVTCPSSSICFAAGDRGTVLQSSNGGESWTFSPSVDGNPIYGLTCPSTSVCYTVDNFGHVMATFNGGASWALQSTPVTSPGINVPGSGGPNPYAGLFGISCVSTTTCVAVGGYPPAGETYPPIVETTNSGATWMLESNPAPTADYLMGASCLPGTTTCFAVGYAGTILETTDLMTWTAMTSNTTKALTGITCLSTTDCVATGQTGEIDVYNGTSWTSNTSTLGTSAFLAGVTCTTATNCYAVGKEGVTESFDSTNVSGTLAQLNGGGYAGTLDAVTCPSTTQCVAVGASGTILTTVNGGQTWLTETDPVTVTLDGVACVSTSTCVAIGTGGDIIGTTNGGSTWTQQTSGVTAALDGVTCTSTYCVVVGAIAPTDAAILTDVGGTGAWTTHTNTITGTLAGVKCVATNCYAAGAVVSGSAVIVASTNSGVTWTRQTSNDASLALSSVACVDATDCYAGGANGTVLATNNGGTTWYQEGNPMSGPLTALNVGTTSSILAIDAAACSAAACFFGTASSGNIMTTPILNVTVNASGVYGTTPALSGLAPTNAAISYNPSIGASVTGTLTCSTNATNTSPSGSGYTISGCSGLSASGYNVIYNYAGSSYSVTPSAPTATIASPVSGGTYSVGQVVSTSFSCADASGPGIATCVDNNSGSAPSGSLNTSAPGTYTYTVTATSTDSQSASSSISYTVAAAPTATIASPASGGTYSVGQVVSTSFSCAEGASGPGIASCIDNNSGTAPSGTLDTSAPGTFTYTVTATSSDGQSGTASITYTVAAAPTATITSPSSGGTYSVGQVVSTSFSCAEGASGPGIATCVDNNSGTAPSGSLDTSAPGTFTYTVTATSSDGQSGTASITYTVAAAPTATIASPVSGGTYSVGQVVSTSFSCAEGASGPGIATCVDNNLGTAPSGSLDTSTPGTFTYTVTATSSDGQTGTASISYTVGAAPSATITSPASGGTYSVGQSVETSFGCSDGSNGPGIATCVDSNAQSSPDGALVTSTPGTFTYTVTATSLDGQTGTASISYTVAAAPTATIASPVSGGTYSVGQVVSTSFSCAEGASGPGIATCVDNNSGTAPSGSLDTSAPGTFTYTVTATSSDGQSATASITYTVAAAPTATIASPASGGTYLVGQSVETTFSCAEGASGPGLASCLDTNAQGSPNGALVTSSTGTFTYTVTATSLDGQTGTASISYTVANPASAPLNLSATTSSGAIDLAWNPSATNGGSPITGYNIWETVDNGAWTEIASNQSGTTYVDHSVSNGHAYRFAVSAVNAVGVSPWSLNAYDTLAGSKANAPTGLTATTGVSSISLTWNAATGGSTAVTGYDVWETVDNGAWTELRSNVAGTSYVDSSVSFGHDYRFAVAAVNLAGESTWSVNAYDNFAGSPANAPTNLNAVSAPSSIDLSWTPATGGSTTVTGYDVWETVNNGAWSEIAVDEPNADVTDTNVTAGDVYRFAVAAVDAAGESKWSINAYDNFGATPAGAPTNLSAVPSGNSVVLSWSAPTSTGNTPITGYDVWRIVDNGPWVEIATNEPNLTVTDTSVSVGHSYRYAVAAVNTAGESKWSINAYASFN